MGGNGPSCPAHVTIHTLLVSGPRGLGRGVRIETGNTSFLFPPQSTHENLVPRTTSHKKNSRHRHAHKARTQHNARSHKQRPRKHPHKIRRKTHGPTARLREVNQENSKQIQFDSIENTEYGTLHHTHTRPRGDTINSGRERIVSCLYFPCITTTPLFSSLLDPPLQLDVGQLSATPVGALAHENSAAPGAYPATVVCVHCLVPNHPAILTSSVPHIQLGAQVFPAPLASTAVPPQTAVVVTAPQDVNPSPPRATAISRAQT